MHKYRRKSIMFLMGYLLMFFAVLIISLYNLNRANTLLHRNELCGPELDNHNLLMLAMIRGLWK
jgi:hypothetical protein